MPKDNNSKRGVTFTEEPAKMHEIPAFMEEGETLVEAFERDITNYIQSQSDFGRIRRIYHHAVRYAEKNNIVLTESDFDEMEIIIDKVKADIKKEETGVQTRKVNESVAREKKDWGKQKALEAITKKNTETKRVMSKKEFDRLYGSPKPREKGGILKKSIVSPVPLSTTSKMFNHLAALFTVSKQNKEDKSKEVEVKKQTESTPISPQLTVDDSKKMKRTVKSRSIDKDYANSLKEDSLKAGEAGNAPPPPKKSL